MGSTWGVREEASGAFAVLDVGASRLFEQPETRKHLVVGLTTRPSRRRQSN